MNELTWSEQDNDRFAIEYIAEQDDFMFAEIDIWQEDTEINLFIGQQDGLTMELIKEVINGLFAKIAEREA